MIVRAFLILWVCGWCASSARAQAFTPGEGTMPSCAAKFLSGAAITRQAGAFADPNIDVTYYLLNLTLTPSLASLGGSVRVTAKVLLDSLQSVTFDLSGAMSADSVHSGASRLALVQVLDGIQIHLDRPYHKNELLTLEVYYHGSPVATGFGSFVFFTADGSPWVWSLSEPYGAHDWWPCKDNTTDKADSVDIWVTIPAGLKVGSNGALVATLNNGNGTQTIKWAERYPIAPYLVSVAVSDYAEIRDFFRYTPTDSMLILHYVQPQSLTEATVSVGVTRQMLGIFSELYGLYPFIKEKYGHAQFGWGGAMEHQTMTSTSNFAELTIAHELAHQWFGDMITCANWPSLWLNEGFATYNEALYLERRYGSSAYRSHLNGMMTRAMRATGTLYVQDTASVANLFNPDRVYAKGAWTLHMLRHVLGDSVFFRSLRAYANDPRFMYKSATTEGFRSVCEAVAGRPLRYFFDEWVFGEGYPQYQYAVESKESANGFDVTVTLTQQTTSPLTPFFTMPLDIRMVGSAGDTTVTVFHTASGEQFSFSIPFNPRQVQIDPDQWILRDVLSPEPVIPTSYELEQNYPNPFNPGTTIGFSLPHRSTITLAVYDALGREVAVLAKDRWEAGTHTVRWEGVDAAGRVVAAGVYYCRLSAESYSAVRKMILVR